MLLVRISDTGLISASMCVFARFTFINLEHIFWQPLNALISMLSEFLLLSTDEEDSFCCLVNPELVTPSIRASTKLASCIWPVTCK